MKKIFLVLFVFTATLASAQNKDYVISFEGLGALKHGMSLSAVEKLLNKKLAITKNYLDTLSYSNTDTAKAIYKGIPIQLEFERYYTAPYKFHMRLMGIKFSSPLCKTASGVGVGAAPLKIIAAFDNYHVNIQPGHYNYYETSQGKGKSTVTVMDDGASTEDGSDAHTIYFFLLNKKVVSFELKANLRD